MGTLRDLPYISNGLFQLLLLGDQMFPLFAQGQLFLFESFGFLDQHVHVMFDLFVSLQLFVESLLQVIDILDRPGVLLLFLGEFGLEFFLTAWG
jgi:hypothetical protein